VISSTIAILAFTISFFKNEIAFEEYVTYMSFVIGLLATFQKVLDLSGTSSKHKISYHNYEDIMTRIVMELVKPRDKRTDPGTFMNEILTEINMSNKNAPHVYVWVIKSFYKKHQHLKLSKPPTMEQLETLPIAINTPEPSEQAEKPEELTVSEHVTVDIVDTVVPEDQESPSELKSLKKTQTPTEKRKAMRIRRMSRKCTISDEFRDKVAFQKNSTPSAYEYEMNRFKHSEEDSD
jgi:hypothetical protein